MRNVCSRPWSVGSLIVLGTGSRRIVIFSPPSRASTSKTLWPALSIHHLTTRHFCGGLPGSLTVMMRPVGSSAARGDEGAVVWPRAKPPLTTLAMTALIHRERTMRQVSIEPTCRTPAGPFPREALRQSLSTMPGAYINSNTPLLPDLPTDSWAPYGRHQQGKRSSLGYRQGPGKAGRPLLSRKRQRRPIRR